MNWLERDGNYFCGSYRIYRTTRGNEAWFYGGKVQCVLARELTLESAKKICENHKVKEQPK